MRKKQINTSSYTDFNFHTIANNTLLFRAMTKNTHNNNKNNNNEIFPNLTINKLTRLISTSSDEAVTTRHHVICHSKPWGKGGASQVTQGGVLGSLGNTTQTE